MVIGIEQFSAVPLIEHNLPRYRRRAVVCVLPIC